MPRTKSYTSDDIAQRALGVFWANGYAATSMAELVEATGVSRKSIYADYGGKLALFVACFDQYQNLVVTPALRRLEHSDAGLDEIAAYFEQQISLAEQTSTPRPGCFVGNSTTEVAPHNAAVAEKVKHHNQRLLKGFTTAIGNAIRAEEKPMHVKELAEELVVFTTGLWAHSRIEPNCDHLRKLASTYLKNLARSLA